MAVWRLGWRKGRWAVLLSLGLRQAGTREEHNLQKCGIY